jgi:MFS family permease
MPSPQGILSPAYLRASIAIYTTVALVAFEGTAVAAALPQVTGDLGQLELLPWVVTVFLFASGVATVMAGTVVDALGTARVFRWAVLIFSIAGFIAGFAPSMPALIAIRFVQGAGGGMVVAVGLAATSLVYPGTLSGRAFAANSTVWGVMGAAAPAIAAVMLSVASWRWIFFINLPLGAIALIAGWRALPGPKSDQALRLDPAGSVLVAIFTVATLLAVDELSAWSAVWLAVAALSIVLYRKHARRVDRPVVRPEHVFRLPYSMLGLVVAAMITAAFAANVYVTLYVSAGRGAGPTLTAWSVFFFTIGWTLGANTSSRLLDRMAESSVIRLGAMITAPGLAVATVAVWLEAPLPFVFFGLLCGGVGIGLSTNAALTLLRSVTPEDQIGRAAAAHQFIRNQGFTLGSAMGGSVLLFVVGSRLGTVEPVQQLLAGEGPAPGPEVAGSVVAGYATTLLVGLVISLLSVIPVTSLRRHLAAARAVADESRKRT